MACTSGASFRNEFPEIFSSNSTDINPLPRSDRPGIQNDFHAILSRSPRHSDYFAREQIAAIFAAATTCSSTSFSLTSYSSTFSSSTSFPRDREVDENSSRRSRQISSGLRSLQVAGSSASVLSGDIARTRLPRRRGEERTAVIASKRVTEFQSRLLSLVVGKSSRHYVFALENNRFGEFTLAKSPTSSISLSFSLSH